MIPISTVRLDEATEALVLAVLRSGHLTQGKIVEQLESSFADVSGCRHVVAVNSGTSALIAALRVLGVGPGDEVVTSPFTFVATVNAILNVGATVRFADIGPDFTLDPEAVRAAMNPLTRVIMPVHLYGQPADMVAITKVAESAGVAIVEDAAQAHLATVGGRAAGSFGVGCFSLYATKNVCAGEGGLVTTDDDRIAEQVRILRNQGMRTRYDYVMVGDNYRMSDVHAAIALAQLSTLEQRTRRRADNAARLRDGLRGTPGLMVPEEMPGRRHVWHQFTVRVTADASLPRDDLAERLTAAGIGSAVYYPRTILDYAIYRGHPRVEQGDFPMARRAAAEVLSLPVHPWVSDSDVDEIIDSVREALGA